MKKFLSILMLLSLVFGLLGCATKQVVPIETVVKNETIELPKSIEKPKTTTKLVMVTNCEFPPYEYVEGGINKGIDVDIAKIIGSKLGAEIEILDVAFDSILPTIMSGKADFAMAGMTVTEDRKQNVDFSHTYQTSVQNVIVNKDSGIESIDNLDGKKIGVVMGYTADMYATDDYGEENIERFKSGVDAVQALIAKKIDVVMIDDQVAKNFVNSNKELIVLDTPYAEEEYAIAVKKGNTELLNKINQALDELKADGSLSKIVASYIN